MARVTDVETLIQAWAGTTAADQYIAASATIHLTPLSAACHGFTCVQNAL